MDNFCSSHYTDAFFINNLLVSRIYSDLILSLVNDQYHRISVDRTDVITVKDSSQLQAIIHDDFAISLIMDECNSLYQKTCIR